MDLTERKGNTIHRHPWEISRARSILSMIGSNTLDTQFADIGAGDRYFTNLLSGISEKNVYAVDINYRECMESEKVITYRNIADLPENTFDCVLLMDVLEHVKDEDLFLEQIKKKIKKSGKIIITVSAHQFLFSNHDTFLRHCRRYSNKQLLTVLRRNNLAVQTNFYFYSSLFFIRLLMVVFARFKQNASQERLKTIADWKYPDNHPVTLCITNLLDMDFIINKFFRKLGILLPGLSLCAICRKP